MQLKVGDRVSCRLQENRIVSAYSDFDDIKSFDIIAVSDNEYFVYVPCYISVKGTIKINSYDHKSLKILPKFLGEEMIGIFSTQIICVHSSKDGQFCKRCNEFYDYAVPNTDEGTLICFACRSNPYR